MSPTNRKALSILMLAMMLSVGAIFLYTIFRVVAPLYFAPKQEITKASLDKSLDEAVDFLSQRQDLTPSTPSATLTKEANQLVVQIVNGSGVAGAAQNLANDLATLGITATEIANSTTSAEQTVVSFKNTVLPFRDQIVEKIGQKTGGITFETLGEQDTFDIRILIGQ